MRSGTITNLGPGCADSVNLERVTREAVAELDLDAEIEKVTSFPEIMGYDIMRILALVIDEEVVMSGRVPTTNTVREFLESLVS